jgi:hypothetical protein
MKYRMAEEGIIEEAADDYWETKVLYGIMLLYCTALFFCADIRTVQCAFPGSSY